MRTAIGPTSVALSVPARGLPMRGEGDWASGLSAEPPCAGSLSLARLVGEQRGEQVGDLPSGAHVVDAYDAGAASDGVGAGGGGGGRPLVDLQPEEAAQEDLVGDGDEERVADLREAWGMGQESDGLPPRLAEDGAGVECGRSARGALRVDGERQVEP